MIDFTIKTKFTDKWTGIGFSDTPQMVILVLFPYFIKVSKISHHFQNIGPGYRDIIFDYFFKETQNVFQDFATFTYLMKLLGGILLALKFSCEQIWKLIPAYIYQGQNLLAYT